MLMPFTIPAAIREGSPAELQDARPAATASSYRLLSPHATCRSQTSFYCPSNACSSAESVHDLQVPEKARRYAVSTRLPNPVDPADGLVLQYEVKYSEGVTCGGAYLKFFTEDPDFDPTELTNSSPYSVMFGPDKWGAPTRVDSDQLGLLHTARLCLTQLAPVVPRMTQAAVQERCCRVHLAVR